MKEVKQVEGDRVAKVLNSRTVHRIEIGIGVAMLVIAIAMIVIGSAHGAAQPTFQITTQNSGNIYTISVSTNFTMPANTSAMMMVVSSSGGIMFEHNFTGSYATVMTLYQNAIVEISFQGQIVQEKVISVVPTQPQGYSGMLSNPLVVLLISIGVSILLVSVSGYMLIWRIKRMGNEPGVYDPMLSAEINDADLLLKAGIITKNERDWVLNEIEANRKRGYELPLDNILTKEQIDFINLGKKLLKENEEK